MFSANIPLLVIALFQCIGVAYFYGLQRSITMMMMMMMMMMMTHDGGVYVCMYVCHKIWWWKRWFWKCWVMMKICRFSEDIELMTGTRPGMYLCICWKYISPAVFMSPSAVSVFTGNTYITNGIYVTIICTCICWKYISPKVFMLPSYVPLYLLEIYFTNGIDVTIICICIFWNYI